jgi:quinol monooxygenase YgiN
VEEGTKQEKGVQIYDLKKTEIDNFIFLQYGEWESKDAFMEHIESDYVQEFVSFCNEHEIVWLMNPLKPVVDDPDTPPQSRNHDDSEGPAHVLFRYFVPTDKHKDFVEAFQDAAEETWKEEGNHIYSLRKTITDNVEFWGYGTWDSMEDYVQHFKSDYVRNLRKFARENGIVWMLAPLYKIGDQPEFD